MVRARLALLIAVAIAAGLPAREAAAGDVVYDGIAAASADGAYEAIYSASDGDVEPATCGMRRVGAKELLVPAVCTAPDSREVLPFEKWRWTNPTPDVRRLKKFDPAGADNVVRNGYDRDTQSTYAEAGRGSGLKDPHESRVRLDGDLRLAPEGERPTSRRLGG